MIKYVWVVMLALIFLHWMLYTISDTIYVFKHHKPGCRFDYLETPSQAFYTAIPTAIFFYSLISYLV